MLLFACLCHENTLAHFLDMLFPCALCTVCVFFLNLSLEVLVEHKSLCCIQDWLVLCFSVFSPKLQTTRPYCTTLKWVSAFHKSKRQFTHISKYLKGNIKFSVHVFCWMSGCISREVVVVLKKVRYIHKQQLRTQ